LFTVEHDGVNKVFHFGLRKLFAVPFFADDVDGMDCVAWHRYFASPNGRVLVAGDG